MNAAACILTNDNNEILLQHRGDDHFWGLPGGIMEMDETPEQTCIREVKEETGYDIKITSYLGVFHNRNKSWPNGDKAHIMCHIYCGTIIGGTIHIDGNETLDLQYFKGDQLPSIDAIDHLEAIHQYYGK
jgi:8-oxo-dGTP pyrophosphatase MutT (NUDIX family)